MSSLLCGSSDHVVQLSLEKEKGVTAAITIKDKFRDVRLDVHTNRKIDVTIPRWHCRCGDMLCLLQREACRVAQWNR